MNSQKYIEMQLDLVQSGEIDKFEANEKIAGFIQAENGDTWKHYRAAQRQLVGWDFLSKAKANDRLHGFKDYIRLNR